MATRGALTGQTIRAGSATKPEMSEPEPRSRPIRAGQAGLHSVELQGTDLRFCPASRQTFRSSLTLAGVLLALLAQLDD